MLLGKLVDFTSHQIALGILIRVVQELDLLQDLQSANGDLLELVDAYDLLRRPIIHLYRASVMHCDIWRRVLIVASGADRRRIP